ncbi:MAG TPA: glutathione S-transferase family protein [Acidimicrobiales bacterium]|jgi:glutathione S-transferase
MSQAILTINSKNYGAWSLRGWLSCRMAGLDFTEQVLSHTDPSSRAELLLLSPSFLVPRLEHDEVTVWDTLAIGEYLCELLPEAGLLPEDPVARARCRSICGEMHSGFAQLRSALPMNVKARHTEFKVWSGAQADVDRIVTIWRECLERSGGPYLFGSRTTLADAMYAPVCTRFVTYAVPLGPECAAYRDAVMALPDMLEWAAAAAAEPDEVDELDVEF